MASRQKRKSSSELENSPPSKQSTVPTESEDSPLSNQSTVPTESEDSPLSNQSTVPTESEDSPLSNQSTVPTESEDSPLSNQSTVPTESDDNPLSNPSTVSIETKDSPLSNPSSVSTTSDDNPLSNQSTVSIESDDSHQSNPSTFVSIGTNTSEPVTVTISTKKNTVLRGSSLTLTCTFSRESTPSAVLWTRCYEGPEENIQLTPDNYIGGTVDTPSLTIHQVGAEDSGMYICKVTFEGDQVCSNPLTINVDTTSAVLPEETNYLRIYFLCLNIGTDSVRHYFDRHVPPASLHGHLSTHENNLRYTQPMKCNKDQLNLLFPAIPMLPVSSTYDFTLLYKLVRNTLNVPPPARGWGFPPHANDISEEDDVERIRKYRNLLAHIEQCKIDQSVFGTMWGELSQAIQRLSKGSLAAEVNDLEHKRLDQDIRSQMVDDILQFRKDVKDLQKEVEDIITNQKDQQTRIANLEARPVPQHIPKHIRDNQIEQLDAWARENMVFYSGTAAVKEATDEVNQHQIVTILGGPGAGKTSIARHIALEYQKQNYEVVPICQPEDIIQFGDKSLSQVFVLDDVLGVFSFDISLYNKLNNTKASILSALGTHSKLICTSRTLVYNQAYKVGSFVLENVIDVESKPNQLTVSDKINIFKNHCTNKDVKKKFDNLSFENCRFMFPLLCRIFAASDKHSKNPKAFFDHPVECVKKELDIMSELQKTQYAVLVLCMMNSKKILSMNKPLTSINKKLTRDIFDSCSDCSNPTNSQIHQALQDLSGTYLTKPGDHYTFIHDSIYEIVAYHFGKQYVELMIKYMSSTFVRNKLVISGTESVDKLSIEVTEDRYRLLSIRLLKDIKGGKLYDVFTSPALSHTKFADVFMKVFKKQMSYQQFKKMFLTTMTGDTDHITQQSKRIAENKEKGTSNYYERQQLLLGYTWRGYRFSSLYSIRLISFIVYYGHSHLLQGIIDYVLRNHDTVTSVVGSALSEQSRLLTLAVYSGNEDALKILLKYVDSNAINISAVSDGIKQYSNSNMNNHRKHTAVTAACYVGNLSAVKILRDKYAKLNPGDKPYFTPLVAASKAGHLDIVSYLIEHGGDVNLCSGLNESPLYIAALYGHLKIVAYLVNHGGDINLRSYENRTPLEAAVSGGHLDVVKYLEKNGGDLNLCSDKCNSSLYIAADMGKLNVLKYLVDRGGDLNLRYYNNQSLLYVAVKKGNINVVRYLVNHDVKLNRCDKDGRSPLWVAAEMGKIDVVTYLIRKGAEIDLCDEDDESPLYAAANEGHLEVVEFLIDRGAEIELPHESFRSPIEAAAFRGHSDVFFYLVEHVKDLCQEEYLSLLGPAAIGGDPDVFTYLKDRVGDLCDDVKKCSLLYDAAEGGHLDIVIDLLDQGCQINYCGYENQSILFAATSAGQFHVVSYLVDEGAMVNLCDKDNRSPLYEAVCRNFDDALTCLVENGGNVNLCTSDNKSPLYAAALRGNLYFASYLVDHGGDVNLCTKDSESPLYAASKEGDLDVVSYLVDHGGVVNLCTKDSESPLYAASKEGYLDVVSYLVDHGGDVNLCTKDSESPLYAASKGGYLNVVSFLVDRGGDVNLCTKDNKSPLYAAAWEGHLDVVSYLVDHGGDVNLCTKDSESPLYAAAWEGHLEVVSYLVDHGGDVNLCTKDNESPLYAATEGGHEEVVLYLRDHGGDVNLCTRNSTPPP